MWRVDDVRALAADHTHRLTFFCGGSRNFRRFIGVFDEVFVLTVDAETLARRLAMRGADEFGGTREQRNLVLRVHRSGEDTPSEGTRVDATAPVGHVVDEILRLAQAIEREEVPGRRV